MAEAFGWILDLFARLGYAGIATLVALETIVPPIPSEVILPLAGYLAYEGRFHFAGVVAAATVGAVVGGWLFYEMARRWGPTGVRRFFQRHRWLLVDDEDIERAEGWFERRGGAAVFFGRFLPGVRSLVSIPAGVAHMGRGRFLAYTTAGSAVWNLALAGLGFVFHDQWQRVADMVDNVGLVIWILLGFAVGVFVARRLRRRKAHAKSPQHS